MSVSTKDSTRVLLIFPTLAEKNPSPPLGLGYIDEFFTVNRHRLEKFCDLLIERGLLPLHTQPRVFSRLPVATEALIQIFISNEMEDPKTRISHRQKAPEGHPAEHLCQSDKEKRLPPHSEDFECQSPC